MVLSTHDRRSIEDRLAEAIGTKEAQSLMDALPSAEPATEDFVHAEIGRLEGQIGRLDGKIDTRFGQLDTKLGRLEGKFDAKFGRLDGKIDAKFGKIDTRFGKIDATFGRLDGKIDARFSELRAEMHAGFRGQTRWFAAMMLTGFGAVLGLIVATS